MTIEQKTAADSGLLPGNRLIPILREGVGVIKLICYKKFRDHLASRYPHRPPGDTSRLAGALLNELFGTPNHEPQFVAFVLENQEVLDTELRCIATTFAELRIPITDALRMHFLCDLQEGVDSAAILARAHALGILLVDREVPLPKNFLNLVRTLGKSFNLLIPAEAAQEASVDGDALQ